MRPYLGTNVTSTSVEEVHYRKLVEEHEILLALFDGLLFDEHNRRIGGLALNDFVVLTDHRLVTWVRGLWTDSVDGFLWKDVDVVESRVWDPFHGRVRLAIRLPGTQKRTRRIAMKGSETASETGDERIIINTLDYMPAEDVFVMADMVAWVGDQVLAGLTGTALQQSFAVNFPLQERERFSIQNRLPGMPHSERSAPEPEPEPEPEPPKRSWWPFGKKKEELPESAHTAEGLVAAYERQHGGPEDKVLPASAMPPGATVRSVSRMLESGQPIADQVGIYGLSRTLRLAIEVPQRLRETLNRANEAMQGTSELIENLQNPEVRRNAMTGLNMALGQQELQQGPLGSLAPAMRAALGLNDQQGDGNKARSQRIQVVRSGGRVQVPSSTRSQQSSNDTSSQRQQPIKTSASPIKISKPVVNSSVRLRRQSDDVQKTATEPTTTPARNGSNQLQQFSLADFEKDLNGTSLEPPHTEEAANREPARRLTVRKKSRSSSGTSATAGQSKPAQSNGSGADTTSTDTTTSSNDESTTIS